MEVLAPQCADALAEAIRWALGAERGLEVMASGSKRGWGRPVADAVRLDLTGLSGIDLYQPEELVLTARAAPTIGGSCARPRPRLQGGQWPR
jgi:glycolate oxidase FAD binding subunit